MKTRSKLLFAAFTAMLVFSLAVGTASANRLSVSNRNFRATWSALRLNPGEVTCQVTLEGSFHSATISKVVGALVGHISRGIVKGETCTNGQATILQEQLPWHVQYGGFEGTLPNISGVRLNLIGAAFRVRLNLFGLNCLVKTSQATPASGIARITAGTITSLRADESRTIPLINECSGLGNSNFAGEARVFLLGTTASINIRLI